MSNSNLVVYTKLSPNCTRPRNHKIDTITIHCMAGNLSVETCGNVFANRKRRASSNYGIGSDGRIALYVDEGNRSWCSGNAANDHRAITIEVANTVAADPWPVSDAAYQSLIKLCADICRRNGIKKLLWRGDKRLIGQIDKQNMTVHRWFQNKACVPTNTEVLTRDGWVKIADVEVGDEIACADLDNLRITFEEVYDKVPVRRQDTYTANGLTATKDHRMVYRNQYQTEWRIEKYNKLLSQAKAPYVPTAGFSENEGPNMSRAMIAFCVAVQADGHYMRDSRYNNGAFGLEFHLKKERKIERIRGILDELHLEYSERKKSDGSTSIRLYGADVVTDLCERYLHDKKFTWEWLNLSPGQARFFLEELLYWDGCKAAGLYTSRDRINLDIVSAIAATNGVGSYIKGDNVVFKRNPYTTIRGEKRNNHNGPLTNVTCVSVKTGIFLCRQNGKTFIIGNCPGDYLYNRHGQIAAAVNALLGEEDEMSEEEVKAYVTVQMAAMKKEILDAVEKMIPQPVIYNSVEEVPEWGRESVQKRVDSGVLLGTGDGLGLTNDMVRFWVVADREEQAKARQ